MFEDPVQNHVGKLRSEYSYNNLGNPSAQFIQEIERKFNLPLRSSPAAAGSKECLACASRGRSCLMVK